MVINIIVMHVKVSNSDYIELVFCVFLCVQWMLNCCTFMTRE